MSAIHIPDITFLSGRRVYIRPFLEKDLPYLLRWFNDHDGLLQFLGSPLPNTEAREREWIANQVKDKQAPEGVVFMIVLKKGNIPIGTMGLHGINWIDRKALTGASIGEDVYRGKGYGSEAKELLLRYAFESLGLNCISSTVIASNARSIRYNEKCGYVHEGIMREAKFVKGMFVDVVRMSILRKDWDARQKTKTKKK